MKRLAPIAIMALRLAVLSPFTGALIGCLVAYPAFNFQGFLENARYSYGFSFTSGFGIPLGGLLGGICGALAFWPLRRVHPVRIALFLGGGSLIVGIMMAAAAGPAGGMVGSIVGFWCGFGFLMMGLDDIHGPATELTAAAEDQPLIEDKEDR